ncbi:hypothetical protein [Sphingomonas sp. MMS24-J13]|uniref:hypothetical protein n=1 Tax=Sphingomonas sp. MMS24-J13 TaxID=3238686 RepID=UPI00384B8DFB
MARQQKLKVFRTPIGFHDAYVAAPSQKAALEAWGSDADLFARGIAEVVTDEDLTHEPLEHPGEVIRRLRGSAAEQFAALPPDRPRTTKAKAAPAASRKPAPKKPPKPRPDRAALDRAERDLDDLLDRQKSEDDALRAREQAIARERRDLDRAHESARREAERTVDEAREKHSRALDRWIEDQG